MHQRHGAYVRGLCLYAVCIRRLISYYYSWYLYEGEPVVLWNVMIAVSHAVLHVGRARGQPLRAHGRYKHCYDCVHGDAAGTTHITDVKK